MKKKYFTYKNIKVSYYDYGLFVYSIDLDEIFDDLEHLKNTFYELDEITDFMEIAIFRTYSNIIQDIRDFKD